MCGSCTNYTIYACSNCTITHSSCTSYTSFNYTSNTLHFYLSKFSYIEDEIWFHMSLELIEDDYVLIHFCWITIFLLLFGEYHVFKVLWDGEYENGGDDDCG